MYDHYTQAVRTLQTKNTNQNRNVKYCVSSHITGRNKNMERSNNET